MGWTTGCVSSSSAGKVVMTGPMTDCVLLLSICAAVAAGWSPDCTSHRCVAIVCSHGSSGGVED